MTSGRKTKIQWTVDLVGDPKPLARLYCKSLQTSLQTFDESIRRNYRKKFNEDITESDLETIRDQAFAAYFFERTTIISKLSGHNELYELHNRADARITERHGNPDQILGQCIREKICTEWEIDVVDDAAAKEIATAYRNWKEWIEIRQEQYQGIANKPDDVDDPSQQLVCLTNNLHKIVERCIRMDGLVLDMCTSENLVLNIIAFFNDVFKQPAVEESVLEDIFNTTKTALASGQMANHFDPRAIAQIKDGLE